MIAEIFYPKELKEIISDLRSSGDLNEESLGKMNWYVFKRFGTFVLVSSVLFGLPVVVIGNLKPEILAMCILGSVLLIGSTIIEIRKMLARYPVLYTNGEISEGQLKRVLNFGLVNSAFRVEYSYQVDSKIYQNKTDRIPNWFSKDSLASDENIRIFYDPKKPAYSAPHIQSMKNIFYLKKGKMKCLRQSTTPQRSI